MGAVESPDTAAVTLSAVGATVSVDPERSEVLVVGAVAVLLS